MKLLSILTCTIVLISSCTEQLLTEKSEDCPERICTEEFRSVAVQFKDAAGNPILVRNFTSTIRRTGKSPQQSGAVDSVYFKGSYAVVTDNDTRNLSSTGDTIDVSAVNPNTNQKKTAQYVVKGGKCACHIDKISGPQEIVFN
jgi:hypothetical protein